MYKFNNSKELFRRAAKVIPKGIYVTRGPSLVVPDSYPYFASHGKGAYYWDVDGNRFIDFMCGYGASILGFADPFVDQVVQQAESTGFGFNHPTELMVKVAELLTANISGMDWALFGKNGSDMTSFALQVAREYTGKRKILKAKHAYHSSHAWGNSGTAGVIDEDQSHIHSFTWNNINSIKSLLSTYSDDIAAVLVTPYHHPSFDDSEFSENNFLQNICKLSKQYDFAVISDDIRVGFRASLAGSHSYFKFEPDLTCYSKSLANGYPIAACLGRNDLMAAARSIFITGTFWMHHGPMAALEACMQQLEEKGGVEIMRERGLQLTAGLNQVATRHSEAFTITGLPSMPKVRLTGELDFMRFQKFCAAATKRGVYFHPYHNWFISVAHTYRDIEETIDVADTAFLEIKSME